MIVEKKTTWIAVGSLAFFAACGGDDHGHHHDDLSRVVVLDRGQTTPTEVAEWNEGEGWTEDSSLPAIEGEGERVSLGVEIYDETDTQLVEEGGEFTARYRLAEGADDTILDMGQPDDEIYHEDHVHMYGASEGTTEVEFVLWHSDHMEGHTSPIEITVGDEADGDYRELDRVVIRDRGEEAQPAVAEWNHGEGWDEDELPAIDLEEFGRHSLGVDIYDSEGENLHEENPEEWTARFFVDPDAESGIVNEELDDDTLFHGDHVHVYGIEEGTTELSFVLWHDDHSEGNTDPIAIDVEGAPEELAQEVAIRDRGETGEPVVARWIEGEGWLAEDDEGNDYPGLPAIDLGDRVSLGVDVYDSVDRPLIGPGFGYEAAFSPDDESQDVVGYIGDTVDYDGDSVELEEDDLFHGDHVHVYSDNTGATDLVFELVTEGDVGDVQGETAGEEIDVID